MAASDGFPRCRRLLREQVSHLNRDADKRLAESHDHIGPGIVQPNAAPDDVVIESAASAIRRCSGRRRAFSAGSTCAHKVD